MFFGNKCPLLLSSSNQIHRAEAELRIHSAVKKITYAWKTDISPSQLFRPPFSPSQKVNFWFSAILRPHPLTQPSHSQSRELQKGRDAKEGWPVLNNRE